MVIGIEQTPSAVFAFFGEFRHLKGGRNLYVLVKLDCISKFSTHIILQLTSASGFFLKYS